MSWSKVASDDGLSKPSGVVSTSIGSFGHSEVTDPRIIDLTEVLLSLLLLSSSIT